MKCFPPALSHCDLGEWYLHAQLSLCYFSCSSRPCVTALTLPTCPPTEAWGSPWLLPPSLHCFHFFLLPYHLTPTSSLSWTGSHRTSPLISPWVCVSVADLHLPAWGGLCLRQPPHSSPLLQPTGLPFKWAFTPKPVLSPAHPSSNSGPPQLSCCNSQIQTFTACSFIHSLSGYPPFYWLLSAVSQSYL